MDDNILFFVMAGFAAQMVDGCLGMAYGVTLTTLLLSMGMSPVTASASVHTAEIFTTLVSGLSHLKFRNIDKGLLKKLLLPGVMGGFLGAYVLTAVPGKTAKPVVTVYLIIMALVILRRLMKKAQETHVRTKVFPLGFFGGFFDAIGGGGWGPIVTSTLLARGHNPALAIGSVNLAEFFVTFVEAATFFMILGLQPWKIIAGLIVGGVFAAPLAAYTCKRLPSRILVIMVSALIIFLSIRTLYLTLS